MRSETVWVASATSPTKVCSTEGGLHAASHKPFRSPEAAVPEERAPTAWLPDTRYGCAVPVTPAGGTVANALASIERPLTSPVSVALTLVETTAGSWEGHTRDCVPVTVTATFGACRDGTKLRPTANRTMITRATPARHRRGVMRPPPASGGPRLRRPRWSDVRCGSRRTRGPRPVPRRVPAARGPGAAPGLSLIHISEPT